MRKLLLKPFGQLGATGLLAAPGLIMRGARAPGRTRLLPVSPCNAAAPLDGLSCAMILPSHEAIFQMCVSKDSLFTVLHPSRGHLSDR